MNGDSGNQPKTKNRQFNNSIQSYKQTVLKLFLLIRTVQIETRQPVAWTWDMKQLAEMIFPSIKSHCHLFRISATPQTNNFD